MTTVLYTKLQASAQDAATTDMLSDNMPDDALAQAPLTLINSSRRGP